MATAERRRNKTEIKIDHPPHPLAVTCLQTGRSADPASSALGRADAVSPRVCAALNTDSVASLGVCNDCLAALAGCCFGILEYSMTDFRKKVLSDITA